MSDICDNHRIDKWNDAATGKHEMSGCPYCEIEEVRKERGELNIRLGYQIGRYREALEMMAELAAAISKREGFTGAGITTNQIEELAREALGDSDA